MKNLYNVLIVEKQSQLVHVYKNMLPWEDYGFQVSSITDKEDKAIAYYGEYKHELIFTAIDLKTGNGISLIRQIRHLNPHCNIIVISSHEDYDTVKEAFKAGANDYILKSRIRYSSLATILTEAKTELDKDNTLVHDENWSVKLRNLLGLLRDKQKVDTDVIIELLKNANLPIFNDKYRMVYFRMDNVRIFNCTVKQYDKPAWMSAEEFIYMFQNKLLLRDELQIKLRKIIEDHFADITSMSVLFTKKHSGLIMIPVIDLKIIKNRCVELIKVIKNILGYDFSITISACIEGFDDFIPAYEAVMEYHQHKFYDGDGCVECIEEQKQYTLLDVNKIDYYERIVNLFATQKFDKILSLSDETIQYMIDNAIFPDEVKKYFCSIINKEEELVKNKTTSQVYPFDVLKQGIIDTESIHYLSSEWKKIIKILINLIKENSISQYQKQVAMIILYIDEHLNQKIMLSMIAKSVGLSEIHASRIFKKETGKSIIEYINERKMKKAIELFENENLKIKEIAKLIGMDDQLYFNKVFKKYYKIGPREYRKKM